MSVLQRNISALHGRKVRKSGGFALLVVIVTVAILGAVVGEFGYNANLERTSAANARDKLRAEYHARSGIHVARLLIKIQGSILDRLPANMGTISAFSIAKELQAVYPDFTLEHEIEDGKLNINCGGGLPIALVPPPQGAPPANFQFMNLQPALYTLLMSVMKPTRYDRLFDNALSDSQTLIREDVAKAIIDWTDLDESRFDPLNPTGGGAEDYRYESQKEPYKAHNNYFDTVEELHLVRGVGDRYYEEFSHLFTVYGSCKVNLRFIGAENWPLSVGLVRAAAMTPLDPVLQNDVTMSMIAKNFHSVLDAKNNGGLLMSLILGNVLNTPQQIMEAFKNGGDPFAQARARSGQNGQPDQMIWTPPFPGVPGVAINPLVYNTITKTGPAEVYRIKSTGTISRGRALAPREKGESDQSASSREQDADDRKIQVTINAVFDTKSFNQNTQSQDPNDRQGTWKYWRME